MEAQFESWCSDIRKTWEETFGKKPKPPNLVILDDFVQERIMRCALEVKRFHIDTEDRDALAILAHHTLLQDDITSRRNYKEPYLYGSNQN